MNHKLAIIGFDGATFDLILPWVQQGHLPNFKRLLEEGAHGPLASTIHPLSPQAWSTFSTGKNAGKHGIFDFVAKKPGSYQFALTQGGLRQAESVWQILSRAGRRVVVLNVPFTYPPNPVNGVMISGFDAPRADDSFCHPPHIYRQVKQAIGQYFLHDMYPVGRRKADYEQVLRAEVQNRVAATRYFAQQTAWDFFMVVVNATDLVQHLFWADMQTPAGPYRDVILHVYQEVDAALGEFQSILGHDVTMLVVSDHGAGAIEKSVNLNEWLRRQGWLAFRQDTTSTGRKAASKTINAGRVAMKRYLPRPLKNWLKQRIPGLRNRVESWLQHSNIDWDTTRAFSGGNFGNIYLNLRGREPQGIVSPGPEQETLLAEISAALLALQDPDTGEPVVARVHRREALYSDPHLNLAPDLIIEWRDYAYFVSPSFSGGGGQVFGPPPREDATEFDHSGTHRVNGIFLATGPNIKPGPLNGLRIADVAPTVLHACGLPVPRDMDGQVAQALFKTPRPVAFADPTGPQTPTGTVFSEADEADMAARLRSLGYLE
ncbi:MAG: alkaline phosphatase family protein [Anaerolineae bacterium]